MNGLYFSLSNPDFSHSNKVLNLFLQNKSFVKKQRAENYLDLVSLAYLTKRYDVAYSLMGKFLKEKRSITFRGEIKVKMEDIFEDISQKTNQENILSTYSDEWKHIWDNAYRLQY